jgi:hypothetical protein
LQTIMKRLKRDKRAVSNAIVVMLSLVLVVIIVANIVLWSYQMNQLDWERMQERTTLLGVERATEGTKFSFENDGPVTSHVVAIWVIDTTTHRRYDANLFLDSGTKGDYFRADISLPTEDFIIRAVTERGNVAVFGSH